MRVIQDKKKLKKIRFITLLLFSLLILIIANNVIFKNRVTLFHDSLIYGEIKSIKEFSYKAIQKNNKIIKGKRWRRGHLENDFI